MGHSILIVDDETDIVTMLGNYFSKKGYQIMTAYSGKEAVKKAEKCPDLILLDVNMPDMDGFSVCERIRQFVACPIIFLTARVEEMDKVKGFSSGGDDYIIKPFSLVELEARVGAHLRRELRKSQAVKVKFSGDLSIDYGQKKVFIKDEEIPFAKKDFEIIELLSQHPKQIFDRERIYELLWGYDAEGSSNVVTEHIRVIRSKLSKYGYQTCIETVWGNGYKWRD
ncbi:MAG TPA: response regulator transcription factor [Thermoclostridium sp.]